MTSVTGEIERIEKEIEKNEERLETIDRLRRLKDMPNDEWENLKEEKKALEKQLISERDELKALRWENRKTMLFSVLILGIIYVAYLFFASPSQDQLNSPR